MTADASEFNVGSGVKIEGEVGLGLRSEADGKATGDPDGIACVVGEEKAGGRSGMSITLENGDLEDSRGGDLDLEGDVNPESIEVKGENGQLIVENGVDHDDRADPVIEAASTIAENCNGTTVPADVEEETVVSDSSAMVAEEGNGEEEEQKEVNESTIERDIHGVMGEEKTGACTEEANAELGFDNGHNHGEDDSNQEASMLKNMDELKSDVELAGKENGESLVKDVKSENDLESTVDVVKNSDALVAEPERDEEAKVECPVYDDENQEPKSKDIETDHEEASKPFVAEDSEEETMLNGPQHQVEAKPVIKADENQDIVSAAEDAECQIDADAAVVVETEEVPSTIFAQNESDQVELVVLETQVTERKDQQELKLATAVEPVEETQAALRSCVDQDEEISTIEAEKEQQPERLVTEILPSESSAEQQDMRFSNGYSQSTDECSDKKGTVLVTGTRATLETADDSETSESHMGVITSDISSAVNNAEESSTSLEVGDAVLLENSDVVPIKEVSSSTDMLQVEKEVLADTPLFSQLLTDSNTQPVVCEKVSPTQLDGGNSRAIDVSNPVDTANADIPEKAFNDVAETRADATADDADAQKAEFKVVKKYIESNSIVSLADDQQSLAVGENKAADRVSTGTEETQFPVKEPSASTLDGEIVDTPSGKPQACYIIRIPRYVDDKLSTDIQIAQSEVNEKTQIRDSIKVAIEKQKGICNEFWKKFEAAKSEERAARAAVAAKRQEMDSLQLMINKLKNVHSIEELDDKIRSMEFELQHITMPLKEEKKYIHELKQLRHQRDELTSSMDSKAEIDETFDQKEQIDERFKILKKEMDSLRNEVSQAESVSNAARKKYDDEQQALRSLQQQFRDADALRQKAYGHWRELRSRLIEKNKHFGMYKSDQKSAENYLSSRDLEGLRSHCSNQVEKVMSMWNNDEEFRKQYVKSNMNSTLRRLRTADGRSLGPDEEPPVLQTNQYKVSSSPSQQAKIVEPVPPVVLEAKVETHKEVDSFPALPAATRKQSDKPKKSTKPVSVENKEAIATPVENKEFEIDEKTSILTKEEEEQKKKAEELARKEEELRKKKAETELKEQLRLEQRAKAKEAEERKKKQAEKALARAEFRAQREAEEKEKKKAKKQKKKGVVGEDTTVSSVQEDVAPTESPQPENARELDAPAKSSAAKRSSRQVVAPKQFNKVQPVPLPLRKKGKRKIATWMWVLLTVAVVLLLFLAGNYISFSGFGFQQSSL